MTVRTYTYDGVIARLRALIDAAKSSHFAPPATRVTLEDTVALIQRQQAEIERLRAGIATPVHSFAVEPTNDVEPASTNV